MICRQCGAEVDTRRKRQDGSVQCYNCKKVYYPRSSSPQLVRNQMQKTGKKKSKLAVVPWKRRFLKLPVWLWCVLAALLLILILPGGNDSQNVDVAVLSTAQPMNTANVESKEVLQESISDASALFPQTIFNSKGVTVTITGFDKNALLGPEIKVMVENNSGMNLFLSLGELYCEGWQLSAYTASFDIANGAKAADTIYVLTTELDECGLSVENMVNVTFKNATLNNSDDYMQGYTFEMNAVLQ